MNQNQKKHHFEVNESGYHKYACDLLASWVNGIREQEFKIDNKTAFVPDVTCYKNGVLDSIYEVVYKHPMTGRKLGLIEYWCYSNATELTVFEMSSDYVLAQTERPERIETMECYVINPL
jgi:hypothetical protein